MEARGRRPESNNLPRPRTAADCRTIRGYNRVSLRGPSDEEIIGRVTDRAISVSLPLDADGFLRRECPACERELKWWHSEDSDPAPDTGYTCPYCTLRAGPNEWFTKAQADFMTRSAGNEVLGPLLDQFKSSGFRVTRDPPPAPLTEINDMRRVDFPCHPSEPIKVREDWTQPVHCIVCGTAA